MPSGNFNTTITATPPITINQFLTNQPDTPGNVGVCLSGGGSRALSAGMGQLRGLSYLNLLGKAKALSTVSGGSWLGIPFEFLPANAPTDTAYLGLYVADPGSLTVAELGTLPAGNAGVPLNSDFFSPELLALEAYILWEIMDVPANMLWQTIIGLNILSPYGLSQPGSDLAPTDMFSFDQTTLNAITGDNSSLESETAYLMADQVGSGRTQRPFLICNMAMLMNQTNTSVQLLAPVQSTAFFTGILGTPGGTDANGLAPGGGGITSFSFNSNFVSAGGDAAVVSQTRQWALTDAVGTSSAFFAEMIANLFAYWENDFWAFLEEIGKDLDKILQWIKDHLPFEKQVEAVELVTRLAAQRNTPAAEAATIEFPVLDDMIPLYYYWPVGETTVTPNPQPSQFTDAGSLDNTGICGMLAYNDIDNVISFLNTEVPLAAGQYGVSDGNGGFVPGTYVVVDEMLPPLFGYQPYDDKGGGYVLYSETTDPAYPQYAHNQIFASDAFAAVLQGLWSNSGAGSGSPAIFSQSQLTVQPNSWFGIQGGQTITVVWCYLNYAQDWVNLFAQNQPVLQLIAGEVSSSSFPNYSTLTTDLSATQINLLAGITSWAVVSTDQASSTFSNLFTAAAAKTAVG